MVINEREIYHCSEDKEEYEKVLCDYNFQIE